MTLFRIAIRDEVFDNGALIESRVSHGEARQVGREIVAGDRGARDLIPLPVRIALPGARARVVTRATDEEVSTTISVTKNGVSIVTTPEHLERDLALLGERPSGPQRSGVSPDRHSRRAGGSTPAGRRPALLWRNGSAAVLLHEAIGHPAEHDEPPLELPPWLHVDVPLAWRRQSFRDVPLLRMTEVRVSQENAPFDLPDERIEIHLLGGGGYDPLTSLVTIRVAVSNAGPFEIVAPRERIARSLLGARGESERYPGVIWSLEGQELYVASHAPLMLTTGLT